MPVYSSNRNPLGNCINLRIATSLQILLGSTRLLIASCRAVPSVVNSESARPDPEGLVKHASTSLTDIRGQADQLHLSFPRSPGRIPDQHLSAFFITERSTRSFNEHLQATTNARNIKGK